MSEAAQPRASRVLLVDEDYRSSQRLASLLREEGFDVEVARDGAVAIARLTRAPLPDVLITELKLPTCDGMALARFARAQHALLEVVVLTRYPNLFVPEALMGPPSLILTKPLEYPLLLEALRRSPSEAARSTPLLPADASLERC